MPRHSSPRPLLASLALVAAAAAFTLSPAARADDAPTHVRSLAPYAAPPASYAPWATVGAYSSPRTERLSTGLMITGIVFSVVGAVNIGLGGALYASDHCYDVCIGRGIGAFHMIGGGTLMAIGVPLWIVGAMPVTREGTAVGRASSRPAVMLSPTSASVRWQF